MFYHDKLRTDGSRDLAEDSRLSEAIQREDQLRKRSRFEVPVAPQRRKVEIAITLEVWPDEPEGTLTEADAREAAQAAAHHLEIPRNPYGSRETWAWLGGRRYCVGNPEPVEAIPPAPGDFPELAERMRSYSLMKRADLIFWLAALDRDCERLRRELDDAKGAIR